MKVKEQFKCKVTGTRYMPGDDYKGDRAEELLKAGKLVGELPNKTTVKAESKVIIDTDKVVKAPKKKK